MTTCHYRNRCGPVPIGNAVREHPFLCLWTCETCDEGVISSLPVPFRCVRLLRYRKPLTIVDRFNCNSFDITFASSCSIRTLLFSQRTWTWSLEPSSLPFSWQWLQAPLPHFVLPRIQQDSPESHRWERNLQPRSLLPKTSSRPKLCKESSRQQLRKLTHVNWLFANAGNSVSTTKPPTTKKNTGLIQRSTTLETLDS